MNNPIARPFPLLLLLALNTACSSDDPGSGAAAGASGTGGTSSGGAASGGAAGLAGQSAAAGAVSAAGSASAGAPGASGSGGGTALTPEELRTATYSECSKGCNLVHSACPSSNVINCQGGCTSQADNYFETGKCGIELYQAMSCINRELTAADIKCPATPGGNAQFNGCTDEQLRFAQCN